MKAMAKFSLAFLFLKCMNVILKNEGSYVNHPSDPGGETSMGIARMFYPDLDIKNLNREQAVEIYFDDYWLPMNLTGIYDENLVLQIFDFGINSRSKRYGFNTALKAIQRIVDVEQDGKIGPITKDAINNYVGDIVYLYINERKKYYFDLAKRKPEMQVFLAGWLKRAEHCKF